MRSSRELLRPGRGRRPRWVGLLALAAAVGLALGGFQLQRRAAVARRDATVPGAGLKASGPVLVIGIDGATFDLIDPWIAAGRLPNLAALIERGARGRLRTIEPTLSPAIWTTVATGKLPEVHGILGFDGVPGQTMTTLPTTEMRRVRAFWNILSEHGHSVGVVGWWVTWPAEPVEGYMVSDRVAYTRMEAAIGGETEHPGEIFPAELAPEVRARVRQPGDITAEEIRRFMRLSDAEIEGLIHGTPYHHGKLLPEFKYVYESDRSTTDIALHLLETHPTDVTAVALYGVDAVSHLAWHLMQPEKFPRYRIPAEDVAKLGGLIEAYYVYVDSLVGELVARAPHDATVVIFSDHGFGPTGFLPWSGGHGPITPGAPVAPDGVLILAGPAVRAGMFLDAPQPHVLDLAPTLLALQGLPAAEDMPGRVLTEALRPDLARAVPTGRVATYETTPWRPAAAPPLRHDAELDRDVREKLRSLGYIQ